jgi:hypothetical protein
MTTYQVKIAAEAFAAGFFAHAECDVSVQYGANQPIYDLIAARPPKLVGVSVKGSQDGSWGLTQSHLVAANYASAIDAWLVRHAEVLFCFVQFQRVAVGVVPRAYLASASEVAAHLRTARGGLGDTILHEQHTYSRGRAAGLTDSIPASWVLDRARIDHFL